MRRQAQQRVEWGAGPGQIGRQDACTRRSLESAGRRRSGCLHDRHLRLRGPVFVGTHLHEQPVGGGRELHLHPTARGEVSKGERGGVGDAGLQRWRGDLLDERQDQRGRERITGQWTRGAAQLDGDGLPHREHEGVGTIVLHRLDESIEALPALAATGVRIGIVSNADGSVEARLRAEGICQVGPGAGVPVDIVIDSSAVGRRKPDPRIWDAALEATGVAASESIHGGDRFITDFGGARAAGIRPAQCDPSRLCRLEGPAHPASSPKAGARVQAER